MLRKQFLEVMAAVKEFKDKADYHSVQLDGWTAPTGEFIFQLVEVIDGVPFHATQPTSQGDKCDAAWMIKSAEVLLNDPKCAGLTADNCSVMQDLKKEFVKMAAKMKRIVFYVNCQWHGLDSICAALIGEGGAATADHVLQVTTGPQKDQWTMNVQHASSIPTAAKQIVKAFKLRARLRGTFRKVQVRHNNAALAEWKAAKLEAKRNGDEVPPRPRRLPTLALSGTTRKLSILKPLMTVYANRVALDEMVRSAAFEAYLKDKDSTTRADLVKLAEAIKEGTVIKRAGVLGELLSIVQVAQRMCEYDYQNLSDGLYHYREMLERIQAYDHPLITKEIKDKVVAASKFRMTKLWTDNYALAFMLDPRTRFGANAAALDLAPFCSDVPTAALKCLEERIKVLSAPVQIDIRRHYNKLTAGKVYDFYGNDAPTLLAASDMNVADWYLTYRKPDGVSLSDLVARPLFSVSITQAAVERANSAGKRIAEGRFQLTTENQRMLTAVYINGRQLKAAHRAQFKPDVVGAFRLGAHWPPRFASLTNVALDDVEAEGPDGPAPTALRDALVQVALDDEEDEAQGRTADDAPPKKRKRKSKACAQRNAAPPRAKKTKTKPRSRSSSPSSGGSSSSSSSGGGSSSSSE